MVKDQMYHSFLLLDMGNSRLKVACATEETIMPTRIYYTLPTMEELGEQLRSYIGDGDLSAVAAIYSSVGKNDDEWIARLREQCGRLLILDQSLSLPLQEICYDRHQLGVDRVAAIIGAMQTAPRDFLVIDVGTAITYDLVVSGDRYLGGNISPGPEIRLKSLSDYTSRLPRVEWSRGGDAQSMWQIEMGHNTSDAIWLGIARSIAYEIDGYIDTYRARYPDLQVFLSGGYASDFVTWLKNETFVQSNLVEQGLYALLKYNI